MGAAGWGRFTKDTFELLRIGHDGTIPAGTPGPFPWTALPASPNLENIYLDLGQPRQDVTMAYFSNLGKLRELRSLSISKTRITDEGIAAFKKQRPDVEVKQ